MTEYIKNYSLFNVRESVYGVGRIGSMSWTSPFPFQYSGDHGRSSNFIVMIITEVEIGLTPANFMHITMVD